MTEGLVQTMILNDPNPPKVVGNIIRAATGIRETAKMLHRIPRRYHRPYWRIQVLKRWNKGSGSHLCVGILQAIRLTYLAVLGFSRSNGDFAGRINMELQCSGSSLSCVGKPGI